VNEHKGREIFSENLMSADWNCFESLTALFEHLQFNYLFDEKIKSMHRKKYQ